jgi:LysR family pca operon transcriptional activator
LHIHIEINNDISIIFHTGNAMNRLSGIKLRHLETFLEVARHGSVSRAAESLHLTQPAVTRTVRELEAVCGKPLVAKDGRGIRITPHGEIFLRHAGRSLSAARSGLAALQQLELVDGPLIRIGALPTVSASVVPRAVAEYLESGALNRLAIVTGENRVLLDQLRNGELDIVIGRLRRKTCTVSFSSLSFATRLSLLSMPAIRSPVTSRSRLKNSPTTRF